MSDSVNSTINNDTSALIPEVKAGSYEEISEIVNALNNDSINITTIVNSDQIGITTISQLGVDLINRVNWNSELPIQQTNFKMCAEINHLVGNIVNRSHETMKHQKKIIEGEWEEMCESVEAGNIDTLRDDIADVLFTVYGMAARLGIPADLDFKKV